MSKPLALVLFFAALYSFSGCRDIAPAQHVATVKSGDTSAGPGNSRQPALDTTGYKVFQSMQPRMFSGNNQVTVCILEDTGLAGLSGKVSYYPAIHAAQLILRSDEALYDPEGPAYKPAVLVMKDSKGTVVWYKLLDVPCARIDTTYLDENRNGLVYLLTLDYSIGMGSYNGPVTYFVGFADTGMVNYNPDSGFPTTLKSGWAMRYTESGLQIWSKLCRPADDGDFNIITQKSSWVNYSFKSVRVVKKGFWENEEEDLAVFFGNF